MVVSIKLPSPTKGVPVTGRAMQVTLRALARNIPTELLDRRVTGIRIDKESKEIQIHFEDQDEK
jgi:hypothetical protein